MNLLYSDLHQVYLRYVYGPFCGDDQTGLLWGPFQVYNPIIFRERVRVQNSTTQPTHAIVTGLLSAYFLVHVIDAN